MSYQPVRAATLDGTAPLTVYRAVNGWSPPTLQEPMFWCRLQWAFNRLLNDPDPALAALMHNNGQHGDIPKFWAEAAFEIKRREVAPDKVSRLDALYACFDRRDAFLLVDAPRHELRAVACRWHTTDHRSPLYVPGS